MNTLTGKVAIVTASSRGIGRATAERLAKEGAAVIVNYVNSKSRADDVVALIKANGGKAVSVKGDVSNREEVTHLFDQAINYYGSINIVVNAAGASVFKPHLELTDEDFEKTFDINAKGAMYVMQEAAKRIEDGGRIIQFSTGGTSMATPTAGLYAASKAAGEQMALALAKEMGSRQVTVNLVSPGVTETDGLVMPQEAIQGLVSQTPLGRLGQPNDIADVVAFLASDDARWMTGQNLKPTGGIL